MKCKLVCLLCLYLKSSIPYTHKKFNMASWQCFNTSWVSIRSRVSNTSRGSRHGRRNRGVWGVNVPLTFGTRGVQRGGPMKMIFASTADSFYSVLYKWRTFQPSVLRQNAEMYVRPAHFQRNPCERIRYGTCDLRHKIPVQTISGWSWDISPGSQWC